MMPFEPLDVLEVPPLPALDLHLPDQLVSSTFLTHTPTAPTNAFHVEPLTQEVEDGPDPVLQAFAKRAVDQYSYTPEPTLAFRASTSQGDLDSPGPSKRPIRRAPSDSSLSSYNSSIWDDDVGPAAHAATVKFRGEPARPRLLDLAIAQDITPGPCTLLEAIHDRITDESNRHEPDTHLAPVHPLHEVLRSLVVTATAGTSSDHFQWDPDSASFVWSATLQHRKDVRSLRRLLKEQSALHAALTAAGDDPPPLSEVHPAMLQPWIGSERIMGWSQSASDSIIRPFLDIGALLRRIDDRILAIHRSTTPTCNEAPALAAALDTVIGWLKSELSSQTTTLTGRIADSSAAVLNAIAKLDTVHAVLSTLGNLLSCGQPRTPPFRVLTWLDSTHATLSHLYAHLAASLASGAPSLASAVLAYLLDRTSVTWRTQVAQWVGFPGFESDRTGELTTTTTTLGTRLGTNVLIPWSGAVVDWTLDEKEEEDVGYTLKTSAVPSFLPFRSARAFLEAGRALRLLKKAAPQDHPLVRHWKVSKQEKGEGRGKRRLELPTWRWADQGEGGKGGVEERIEEFKSEIGRWRRERRKGKEGSSPLGSSMVLSQTAGGAVTKKKAEEETLTVEDRFARMSSLFAALPGVTDQTSTDPLPSASEPAFLEGQSPVEDDEESSLLIYLATSASPLPATPNISQRSFDRITQHTLVAPFESWARLINMSLISVFFTDLGLGTYLETCKRFLLLGSVHFERQIVSALFDADSSFSISSAASVFDPSQSSRGSVVAMNARLTAEGIWPPNDSLLSSALNTAVIETVSSTRAAHEDRLERHNHRRDGGEDAVSLAFKDLDERLSFAILSPPTPTRGNANAKSKPSWADPSSIDALDWLTLSFHPPPLIAPLLTALAQSRYQRIWNLLLRVKRCKVAMRTAWQRLFKGVSAAFTFDFRTKAVMQQMRWEMAQFTDIFGAYVTEVGIEMEWSRFMARLEQVRKEVSEELSSTSTSTSSSTRLSGKEVGEGEDGDLEEEDGLGDEEKTALMTASFELKDVFSLARYHERVLDRMLTSCFLKSKQRGVLRIVNDMLQSVLDFAQLCSDFHTPAHDQVEPPQYDDFNRLHVYFTSRMDTLIQALLILKDRREHHPNPASAEARQAERDQEQEGTWGKRRQDVEAEKGRLAMDELEDLRKLDVEEGGRGRGEEVGAIEMLLVRLNASGFYGELD